jgi:tRNA dimethylallyltransferase
LNSFALDDSPQKKVIIVCGPTASGKTSVAIQLAQHFQTEIISADSRQCYKELEIGVARPSRELLQAVPHHFIASHSIHEEITAAGFEQYALEKAAGIFKTHDHVIMVGGTGLYIRAFCEGLDEVPGIDPAIREQITREYDSRGISWLQDELRNSDPLFALKGEMQNPQRMMRALEVKRTTGRSILDFQKGIKKERPFGIIKIGLEIPKERLLDNINTRVDNMVGAGLEQEARDLFPFREKIALQTVGYQEWFHYFEGKSSREETIREIKLHTRQYAKRQMTWFRKDNEIHWFAPTEISAMISFAETSH